MNIKLTLNHLYLLIIGILLFLLLIIFNVVVNYELNTEELVLMDIVIRTVPPLSGAFFSGIVAYLIFQLTKHKDIMNKNNESNNSLKIIKQEISDNYQNALLLQEALTLANSSTIATMIDEEKATSKREISDKLEVVESKFSSQIIDGLLSKLSDKDYLLVASDIKSIKMIIKSLNLLIHKNYSIDNNKIIIDNILTYTNKLQEKENQALEFFNKSYVYQSTESILINFSYKFILFFSIIVIFLFLFV